MLFLSRESRLSSEIPQRAVSPSPKLTSGTSKQTLPACAGLLLVPAEVKSGRRKTPVLAPSSREAVSTVSRQLHYKVAKATGETRWFTATPSTLDRGGSVY